ncbi:hypothetical protein [Corynebacterium sp. 335C]
MENLPEIIAAFGEWDAPQLDVALPWGAVEEIGGNVDFVDIGDVNFGSSDILDVSDIADVQWDESTDVSDVIDVSVSGVDATPA